MTRFTLPALSLGVLLIWMLQHPYGGVVDDSCLYSLFALARLHPQSLANDVFLKFGSQDHYTIFSPIFAAAIRLLGLEPAAALGTLLSQAAVAYGGWLLARRVMCVEHSLLALGLLLALPSGFGAGGPFHYLEGFLTPRQIAEGLTLMGLAVLVGSRPILGVACLFAGLLLHPIMALGGIVMAIVLYGVIPRPRVGLTLLAGAFVLTLAIAFITSSGPFARLDPQWLHIINITSPYLFVLQWTLPDWIRALPAATVLIVGILVTTKPLVRNQCCAALATACCGLLLTIVFCDLLKLQLVTGMQLWRWLWLAQVVAVLLFPVVVVDCWRSGPVTRAACLALVSTWIVPNDPLVFGIALLAIACAASAGRVSTDRRASRLVFLGSCALLAIALVINFASKINLPRPGGNSAPQAVALWLGVWAQDGILYAAVLIGVLWLSKRWPWARSAWILAAGATLACIFFLPLTWHAWTASYYNSKMYAAVASWRAAIPPEAEVIWPTLPIGAWYLLERPSYWSRHQESGDVFSRAKALEIQRRGLSLAAAMHDSFPDHHSSGPDPEDVRDRAVLTVDTGKLESAGLVRACADPQLQFVVSWGALGPSPFTPVTPDPARPADRLHLYRCADFKK